MDGSTGMAAGSFGRVWLALSPQQHWVTAGDTFLLFCQCPDSAHLCSGAGLCGQFVGFGLLGNNSSIKISFRMSLGSGAECL